MTRIGFLGAFSIDNAGDAIVGYAGRLALRALLPDAEQVVYSPALPHAFWNHAWDESRGIDAPIVEVPASTDMAWARELDALVIGGGGIINLDPAFRPFLLGDPAAWRGPPAVWNGVCSQNQPWYAGAHADAYAAVARCCEQLRYVAVRNRTTRAFVRHCGYTGAIAMVPDPALLLELPPASDELLVELGLPLDRPLVALSLGPSLRDPRTTPFYAALFDALDPALREAGAELVILPFSQLQGDATLVDGLASRFPAAHVVRARLPPLALWQLLGRFAFAFVCRYHAMLAAFVHQVPFLVVDEYLHDAMASSKTRELIADLGLEPHYLCPYLPGSPAWKVEHVIRSRGAIAFAGRLAEARARLRTHYAQLVASLGLVGD